MQEQRPQEILVISIFTVITGIILLSAGFVYPFFYINSTNIFSGFFGPLLVNLIQFLTIINLMISISFFANYYGFIKGIEWSRDISIKLFTIFIIIAIINILFYIFIIKVDKDLITILFSIGICGSIIGLLLLYKAGVKAYFYQLKVIHGQEINNIHSRSSISPTKKISSCLIIFLVADILMTVISSFQSIGNIGNIEQEPISLSNTIMEIIEYIIWGGVIVFPIWWFSRTYTNLKELGIAGLNFSAKRVILSFFIPIRNFYEPVRILKTLWKASNPDIDINGLDWKNAAVPTGFGLWWFFVIVSKFGDVQFFGTGSEILQSIFDLILVPIANISTIIIVRRINSRMEEKIYKFRRGKRSRDTDAQQRLIEEKYNKYNDPTLPGYVSDY